MQITPRYDGVPILTIEGALDDQRVPLIRQRRRLHDALAALTPEQWASPSRCEGWTVQDVIAHLVGTNLFWAGSISSGVAGAPTRFLAAFDPVATPAQMVAPMRVLAPADVLEQFASSNQAVFDAVEPLDDAGWQALAESPAGHVPVRLVAHHALWDAWVHERDVLLPLGIEPDREADEIVACLRYAAALGPVLGHVSQPASKGSLVVEATDPDVRVVVDVDGLVEVHGGDAPADAVPLTGRAVDLIEALSLRAPLAQPVPESARWLFGGLAEAFDTRLELA